MISHALARSRRLTLFRTAALPTFLETMNPKRGTGLSVGVAKTTTFRHPLRVPERITFRSSLPLRTRCCCGSTKTPVDGFA